MTGLVGGGWKRIVVIALGLLAGSYAAGASSSPDLATRRARALASFDAVVRADDALTQRTREDLAAVLAARPQDALARVHLGWLLVLSARTLPLAGARSQALEGVAAMDAAVAMAPEDPAVRFIRARSDSQMPLALGREALAVADFARLVPRARRAAADGGGAALAPSLRREILFHAGAFALRRRQADEAIRLLEDAARVAAERPSDADVQSMLALARQELSSQGHGETPHPQTDHDAASAP